MGSRVHQPVQPEPDTGQAEVRFRGYRCAEEVCGCFVTHWTKARMLRWSRHFVLFLVLVSCGVLFVNSNFGEDERPPDLADILESPMLKDIRLEPVPIHVLKKKLRDTNSYYDFLRIFLNKKDISDDLIDDIVNARTIQSILGKKRREYEYESEEYEYDDMASDADQERLDEELTAAWYHVEEMAESSFSECRTPQPEIINIIDHDNRNKIFLPECTVLYRCRNTSGCCGSPSRECGPLRVKVVEMSFLVLDKFGDDSAIPGEDMVEKRMFVNHTECGCREKDGLQSCDNFKCPFPFSMMRRGVKCSCDCELFSNEHNFLCQGIKNGLLPLTETDLACIKSGRCLKPKCTRGHLHIQSGHCPAIPRNSIFPFKSHDHDLDLPHFPRIIFRELAVEDNTKSRIHTRALYPDNQQVPQIYAPEILPMRKIIHDSSIKYVPQTVTTEPAKQDDRKQEVPAEPTGRTGPITVGQYVVTDSPGRDRQTNVRQVLVTDSTGRERQSNVRQEVVTDSPGSERQSNVRQMAVTDSTGRAKHSFVRQEVVTDFPERERQSNIRQKVVFDFEAPSKQTNSGSEVIDTVSKFEHGIGKQYNTKQPSIPFLNRPPYPPRSAPGHQVPKYPSQPLADSPHVEGPRSRTVDSPRPPSIAPVISNYIYDTAQDHESYFKPPNRVSQHQSLQPVPPRIHALIRNSARKKSIRRQTRRINRGHVYL